MVIKENDEKKTLMSTESVDGVMVEQGMQFIKSVI